VGRRPYYRRRMKQLGQYGTFFFLQSPVAPQRLSGII
jgi:hypothetical protein